MSRRPVYAVLGGTFDPPHLGHLAIVPYLVARGLCDRVLVVPVFRHVWGKRASPFAVRHAWAKMAFRPLAPRAVVLDVEAELAARGGRGTSWELLEALARRLPGVRLRLVIGSDLATPAARARYHRFCDLEARYDPIVVPRAPPGESGPLPAVSSTRIRAALAAGDWATVERWVPDAVVRHLRAGLAGWVAVVGTGHVGTHAAPFFVERGWAVRKVRARDPAELARLSRTAASAPPAAVYLAVADPALPAVARDLARAFAAAGVDRRVPVLHASGARIAASDEALGAFSRAGHPVGTLHPICSLRRERPEADDLAWASFGVEGDGPAVAFARRLLPPERIVVLSGLDARGRRAYHAACALVANHLAVLRAVGAGAVGDTVAPALACALAPLLRSSAANLEALGPAGISGPLARGDRAAVAAHLVALDEPAREVYRVLSDRLAGLLAHPEVLARGLPTALACATRKVDR